MSFGGGDIVNLNVGGKKWAIFYCLGTTEWSKTIERCYFSASILKVLNVTANADLYARHIFHGIAERTHFKFARRQRSHFHWSRSNIVWHYLELSAHPRHRHKTMRSTNFTPWSRILQYFAAGEAPNIMRRFESLVVWWCLVLRSLDTAQ